MKALYEIAQETAREIVIRDIGHNQGRMSVTNDAEAVVADLFSKGIPKGRRILYFDSQGDLGELLVLDGRFAGFAFVGGSEEF